jgi:hypothetical protein
MDDVRDYTAYRREREAIGAEGLTNLRLSLAGNGYRPVPISGPHMQVKSAGKRPLMDNWRDICANANEAEIARWARAEANCTNTGLLCGELLASMWTSLIRIWRRRSAPWDWPCSAQRRWSELERRQSSCCVSGQRRRSGRWRPVNSSSGMAARRKSRSWPRASSSSPTASILPIPGSLIVLLCHKIMPI